MNKVKILRFAFLLIFLAGCTAAGDQPADAALPGKTPTEEVATAEDSGEAMPPATQTAEPTAAPTFMDRVSTLDIRLFDYNVNWDSIFPDGDPNNHEWRSEDKSEAFRRLIGAIAPDIACIQEINPERDPGDVSVIFDEVLPLEGGAQWQAISVRDSVIVSRFPLQTEGYELYYPASQSELSQAAALVDLPDETYSQDLYLICSHFAAYEDQEAINLRQMQADVLIRQIADLRTPGDYIDLPANTPFILAGDFNIYSNTPTHHLDTMLTGDIVYEDQFGADLQPDWDDTWLADALPSHQGKGVYFYTWRDDASGFDPFPLDRVIYTDSVMSISNAFILNTDVLSLSMRVQYGLEADDVMINSESGSYDHLPIVVDFAFPEN